MRGLDLLQTQSHRTLPSPFLSTEIELKIAKLEDPWPESTIPQRIFSLLEHSKVDELILDTRPTSESWGMQLRPAQVLLQLEPKHLPSVIDKIHSLKISTTVI